MRREERLRSNSCFNDIKTAFLWHFCRRLWHFPPQKKPAFKLFSESHLCFQKAALYHLCSLHTVFFYNILLAAQYSLGTVKVCWHSSSLIYLTPAHFQRLPGALALLLLLLARVLQPAWLITVGKTNMCWLNTLLHTSTDGASTGAASSSSTYTTVSTPKHAAASHSHAEIFIEQSASITCSRWKGRHRNNLDSAVLRYRLVISQRGFSRSLFWCLRALPSLLPNDWDWRAVVGREDVVKKKKVWNVPI